jgi:thiamine biosynthesis protein ThiI
MNSIVVHYQEIALKGKNRPWFIGRLVRNIRQATSDLDVVHVRSLNGRIELVLGPRAAYEDVRGRLEHVFGIANFSRAGRTAPDIQTIADALLRDLGDRETPSFRVSVKRSDKRFPMTSPQIEREIGGRIKSARGWHVDLSNPALTIHVEMLTGEAFYSFGKDRGPGGLPSGVSGRVACLLSGGIDSPVAAWRLMKRGCSVLLVHFHSYPLLSRASQEKVRELAELLTAYQLHTRLQMVAFGEIQREIVLSVPQPLRVVLYRRMMVRIAEQLARRWNGKALVTGEVVGQVASQTIENISVIDSVASMPILRPLVGTDKEEITAEAQRIGTYPISIVPDQDCCQLFTPRHPATRAQACDVEAAEKLLPIGQWIAKAVEAATVEEYYFPKTSSEVRSPKSDTGHRTPDSGLK